MENNNLIKKEKVNINKIRNMLDEFNKIEIIRKDPTFMEITKYPHYENVCSNILEFFFNDKENHNLNDLLIKSILNILKIKENFQLNLIESIREYYTENGKRIDLFLEYEEFTLTIENKIYAQLDNDLEGYENSINNNYKNKKKYFIVLSMDKIKDKLELEKIKKTNFKNIIYKDLISKIKENLNEYVLNANQKYLNYFIDFLNSINNLYTNKKMNKEIINFIKNNEEEVIKLLGESDNLKKEILTEVKKIKKKFDNVVNVENSTKIKSNILSSGIYSGNDYGYFDFGFYINLKTNENLEIALDINKNLNEWNFILFIRSKNNQSILKNLLSEKQIFFNEIKIHNKTRFKISNLEKNITNDILIEEIIKLLNKLK